MTRPPETIQELIDARGLSLGDLAKMAKLSLRALLKLRNGEVDSPRVTTVAQLAKALKVDPARVRAAIEASRAQNAG